MRLIHLFFCFLCAQTAYAQYSDSLNETQVAELQGTYSKCTIQTKVAGVESSSKVEFILKEDQSMEFKAIMYSGNSQCLGEGHVSEHVEGFQIDSVFFSPQLQLVDLTHSESGDSYSLIFKEGHVSATIVSEDGDVGIVSKLEKQE